MNMRSTKRFDIAVIGTGVHGMHILKGIVDSIRSGGGSGRQIVAIDDHPEPFAAWRRRVRNCGMPYLRSPASHNLDTSFRDLPRYARSRGFQDDWYIPPYHRPSVRLFDDHLRDIASRTLNSPVTYLTDRLTAITRGTTDDAYELVTSGGDLPIRASRVVLALGQGRPLIPRGFSRDARVMHVYDESFDPEHYRRGDRIVIIGGGIAAAHLALYFSRQPVETIWWHRDPISIEQHDSDPCYVGPRCRSLWDSIDDPMYRRQLILRSRRKGSIPPELAHSVFNLLRSGAVRLLRGTVTHCSAVDDRRTVNGRSGGRRISIECDRVILATGYESIVPAAELLEATAEALDLPRAPDGFPLVSPSLEWAPGLYCAGALAELELGPPARNIIGAHLARRRIVPTILAP